MKNKILLIFVIINFIPAIIFSQAINKPKLDSLFNTLAEKNKAMGCIILSKNGNIIYNKAFGYSFIRGNEKKLNTDVTKFKIGSITKMFTATMIFQLIEERRIELTTTLDTYFPNIPNSKQITISNMLNHRSGIQNITDKNFELKPKTHDEILAFIYNSKSDFNPNEKASYSNTNYIILGYIIEKITNESYSNNLEKRITSKIGLSNTYLAGKTNIANNESFSYFYNGIWNHVNETDMSIPGGAGAIVSTPKDLTKFIEALFSLKLVSQGSLNLMRTIIDGFGMAMFQLPFDTKTCLGHDGGIFGFASDVSYITEDSLAIAYCSNGQDFSFKDIFYGVLKIYFNKEYSIPNFNPVFNIKSLINFPPEINNK